MVCLADAAVDLSKLRICRKRGDKIRSPECEKGHCSIFKSNSETSMAFETSGSSDIALTQKIAKRLRMDIPAQCVEGVAANVRIILHHVDIMQGREKDEGGKT